MSRSPVLFPFKNNISLNRDTNRNLYLQLCDQIIGFIKLGKLPPSSKLPGSRTLADDLNIHRKTVIAAYDELIAQGWIETIPARGTFVTKTLPTIKPKSLNSNSSENNPNTHCSFLFKNRPNLTRLPTTSINRGVIKIDEGIPDHRLAPTEEIAKIYRNISKKNYHKALFGYVSIYGNQDLRDALTTYLNQSRGLHITSDNILITRGSQMGIYLASQLLLNSKNRIVVGNTNYMTADNTFEEAGGLLERVVVDDHGINTDAIEDLCKTKNIAAVYVTSHHHHPTTVTLSAKRRMHLLQLAQRYNFAIIEDDYDYDFHYNNAPILPLASNDYNGNVIYIGGFTKIIAPSIRIGSLIAQPDFVDEAANLRRIIDRQGDSLLEQTLAQMINTGDIQRHCNKVLKNYKVRRDLFCSLLQPLKGFLDFEIPDGGMAIWVRLNKKYNWDTVQTEAKNEGLIFNPEWRRYDNDNSGHNGVRIGFASLNEQEIIRVIDKLFKVMEKIQS